MSLLETEFLAHTQTEKARQHDDPQATPMDGETSPKALADGGPLWIAEDEPKTFVEALLRTAATRPECGIKFYETRGESFLSYPDLLMRARRILAGLRKHGLRPKDSVVLQIDSLQNHFATFWACVLGGITPVTVAIAPSYSDKNGVVNKLFNIWTLLDHPTILTSENLAGAVSNVAKLFSVDQLSVLTVEELEQEAPTDFVHPALPTEVIFFQLTSGSTGVPKCIQETHRSIISHVHASKQFNDYSRDDITLNWLPMDHVVPILTFHLKDVYLGCHQIHAKSEIILTNPSRWLELIHENRVTHTWSPNFGFKIAAEALTQEGERNLDLSCVKFFMNAGEQVTTPVVADFLRAVAPLGVRPAAMQPAFGMAEVCTCMTYANNFSRQTGARRFLKSSLNGILQETKIRDRSTVEFVSLGGPVPGVQIRICDAQNNLLPEGTIGRFQIKGDVVTPGYFKNEEANREAFVGDGWFNSGDIGFILNGELYLTGREKEMINIRGAKFYCYEIEDVVSQISEVEPTFVATCGVQCAETGTEGLGILFVPRSSANEQATVQAIRSRVTANLGISPDYIVPVPKKDFPKTTSGKIQRTQFKKMLEAGAFETILAALNGECAEETDHTAQSKTENELCRIWREVLRTKSVSRASNFFELGGDSLRAFQVLSRVRKHFETEIPLQALFENASTVAGMAHWIETHEKTAALPSIQPASRNAPLLLSFPQRRLWLMDQIEGSSSLYTVARGLWISGALDETVLRESLEIIIQRHEILRTTFKLSGEEPVQIIHPKLEIDLRPIELEQSSQADQTAIKLAVAESQKPFHLEKGPLFRTKLFRLGSDRHLLILMFHQLIVDGLSVGLLLEELAQFYGARISGTQASSTPLPIQYADFAQWQRRWMTGDRVSKQLGYWKKQLGGTLPVLKLPTDHPRPAKDTFQGGAETLVLSRDLFDRAKKFNQREGTTLFMTLLAVYQLLLRHYSKQNDILVGSPVGGRQRLETEKLIGFFANTVVMRTRFQKNLTLRQLLAQVRETSIAAYANADLPFEKLVEELQPDRNQPNAGLFQVWIGPIDSFPSVQLGKSVAEVSNLPITPSQFDLTLLVAEKPTEAVCLFEYKSDLFERATIQKIADDYQWLLGEFVGKPDLHLDELDERMNQRDLNRPTEFSSISSPTVKKNSSKHDSILTLINEQCARFTEKTAVVCGGRSLTYGELNRRSNQLANLLQKNGVGPEIPVGICVDRSLEMVIGILAILKAGGAYVPLDPGYPQERLDFMLSEIEAPVVLTQTKLREKISGNFRKIICLDSDENISRESSAAPKLQFTGDNLAYIIFTSGSTGKPKGVLVTHKTLLHSTQARFDFYKEPIESYLLVSSFAFDSSVAGIFWTLAGGGALVLPQETLQQDPLELVQLMLQHRTSHFLSLPSLYSLILAQAEPPQLASLRSVIVAGESCSQELVERHYRLLPSAALFNEYGPTEGTVWSSVIQLKSGEAVTIGRPILNAQIYLLDAQLEPVSTGVAGELFIGGVGIVRGYLKRSELTAEKFIADKFSQSPGARLYRTGDLGRSLPDGRIEFLGRIDHQVKIRGYRIELEEIETILKQHPAVKEAVVVAREYPQFSETIQDETDDALASRLFALGTEKAECLLSEIEKSDGNQPGGKIEQQNATEKRLQRFPDFNLSIEIKNPSFIRPPRDSQRNWLLNRAMAEFADDLATLNESAKRFIPGVEADARNLVTDLTQAVLEEREILEDWHAPLMRGMARAATESHGDVLEIGFGRGVSATMIQEFGSRSHTIVECNDYIIEKFFEPWKQRHADRDIRLLRGKWQEITDQMGTYDGIFFQTYPLNENEFVEYLTKSVTFSEHFFPTAAKHLKKGGVFTYLTHEIDSFSRRHQRLIFKYFSSVTLSVEPLQLPPSSTDLWWADSMVVVKAVK